VCGAEEEEKPVERGGVQGVDGGEDGGVPGVNGAGC
jgi:hypothetical protein